MKIIINGEEQELSTVVNIQELLDQLCIRTRGIAVERNLEIVPRDQYAECRLHEGDRLEIVTLVGGG